MADNVTNINGDGDKTKLPSKTQLMDLRREAGKIDADMAELKGDKGALLKNASNDINVHKPSFKLICKLLNMDETKREEWLTHFDHMRKEMGVDEGRTQQMDLGNESMSDKDAA